MALEWLRRRDDALDTQLRKFLFTSGPLPQAGAEVEESAADQSGSLGIGSLKEALR